MSEADIDLPVIEKSAVDQAKMFLAEKEYEQCYFVLHDHWLNNIDDAQAVELFGHLMKAMGKEELSLYAEKLFQSLNAGEADVQSLFELGFRLIDERQYDVASVLLTKCIQLAPDEPTINYELGFALMNLKQFAKALPYFEKASAHVDSFDCKLNIVVCLTMKLELDKANAKLDELTFSTSDEDEKLEIAQQKLILKRLAEFPKQQELSVRDWFYALYGGVNLDPANSLKDESGVLQYTEIARSILILVGVISGLGETFEAIEFYNLYAKPLAEALAELMSLPVQSYQGNTRTGRALCVIAWASELIGPHQSFIDHTDMRTLFAYGISASDPLPLTPEIVATVGNVCIMPWDERFASQFFDYGESPDLNDITARLQEDPQAAADIVNEVRRMDINGEILETINNLVKYYKIKRSHLVFGNSDGFSKRPPYTAEIPGI